MFTTSVDYCTIIPSTSDERYAANAYDIADKSNMAMKLGCIAVRSGKIVARGFNNYRTFSKDGMIHNSCSCHAEIDVLRKCKKRNIMDKINLYVVRRSRSLRSEYIDTYMESSPCQSCYETMKQFNIKYIIYSDVNGHLIKKRFDQFYSNYITSGKKAIIDKRVKIL
jgi:deoxycytidylate deaminase